MRLLESEDTDPATNLAIEEWALRRRPTVPLLFLYRNRLAVLCGRNQGMRGECDVAFCRANGIGLFRRISGGGTVFQDEGGLNGAFIAPREAAGRLSVLQEGVRKALASLTGRDVGLDARRSLWIAGRKVGGSASLWTGGAVLWHFCLLVESDLGLLARALRSPEPARRGLVASTPAPVANLHDYRPGLDVAAVSLTIVDACRPWLDGGRETIPEPSALLEYRRKFLSAPWTFREDGDTAPANQGGFR